MYEDVRVPKPANESKDGAHPLPKRAMRTTNPQRGVGVNRTITVVFFPIEQAFLKRRKLLSLYEMLYMKYVSYKIVR